MVAIFGSSPIPSQRINSGSSAIFGIGNSAEMKVMPTPRASVDSPMREADDDAGHGAEQPARADANDRAETCCQSAPDIASL